MPENNVRSATRSADQSGRWKIDLPILPVFEPLTNRHLVGNLRILFLSLEVMMSLFKNLVAAAAGVAAYKLIDYGLRRLERDVMHRDVPLEEEIPNAEKDAIVLVGSRLDHIPTVEERNAIARAVNIGASLLGTAVVLGVQERLFEGVYDDSDDDTHYVRNFLISAGVFIALDLLLKPALGMGNPDGRQRRFVSHLASKATQRTVLRLLA